METETLNWARIRRVCEIAENAGMYDVRAHEGYSEPGYDGVPVTGNWNDKKQYVEAERRFETIDATPSRVARILEKLGLELEWCDEWTECSECFKLVRTSGDSYEWTRSYVESEYGSVCLECVESDPEPYVEPMIGEAGQAWTLCTSMLTECGFEEYVGGFEHGLHPGQDSSPVEIAGRLAEHDVTDFVFVLDSVGQFDATFSVWVRTEDLSSLPEDPDELGKTDGPSVSAGLKAALQDVGRAEATVPAGPGPVMVKCDVSTGTATARRVSPEDFVKEAG